MKGDPKVMAGLQESIDLELSLCLQYMLDWRNVKRCGLSIKKGLYKLHEQSEKHAQSLISRLLFLDGVPLSAPAQAKTHIDIGDILSDATAAEMAIVARYAELARQAFDAGDMSNFHLYQHLAKWHREGDKKFIGHLAWLQKQNWQLKEFGETDYEEVKA
jgi:bacterioferritin (cytochrome b1)